MALAVFLYNLHTWYEVVMVIQRSNHAVHILKLQCLQLVFDHLINPIRHQPVSWDVLLNSSAIVCLCDTECDIVKNRPSEISDSLILSSRTCFLVLIDIVSSQAFLLVQECLWKSTQRRYPFPIFPPVVPASARTQLHVKFVQSHRRHTLTNHRSCWTLILFPFAIFMDVYDPVSGTYRLKQLLLSQTKLTFNLLQPSRWNFILYKPLGSLRTEAHYSGRQYITQCWSGKRSR